MVERSKRPGPIPIGAASAESSGFVFQSDRVKLSLPTGESAEILLYGATVISWIVGGEEKLFLSDKASLDGTKAVRGGIPLVFPVFGKTTSGPTAALPQHGFARLCKWELLGKTNEGGASIQVDFGLGPENLTVDMRKQWPYDFGLIYTVNLRPDGLETKVLVRNEGSEAFDFNYLFHTYLRIPDVSSLTIEGLEGCQYKNKITRAEALVESSELSVSSEVDREYANVPHSNLVLVKSAGKPLFTVKRTNLEDVVVWNPWEGAKRFPDFGPEDGFKNMICIEPGAVSRWHTLEPQSIWEASSIIKT